MKPLPFIVIALATWRLSTMLVNEEGPWMAFEHLRLKLGLRTAPHPDWRRETDPPGRMPGSLFACVWCLSVWIGAMFTLLLTLNRKIAKWAAMPLAFSAAACLLDRWSSR